MVYGGTGAGGRPDDTISNKFLPAARQEALHALRRSDLQAPVASATQANMFEGSPGLLLRGPSGTARSLQGLSRTEKIGDAHTGGGGEFRLYSIGFSMNVCLHERV